MSLNRLEQAVFDYVQKHPEERHHWQQKVRALAKHHADPHAASLQLDSDLWYYLIERAGVVTELRQALHPASPAAPLRRISLRNLAEYLLRLWAPPPPRPKNPASPSRPAP